MRTRTVIGVGLTSLLAAGIVAACGGTSGSSDPGAPSSATAAATPVSLAIQHVEPGCHVWWSGNAKGATMELALDRGGALTIFNNDTDAHRLVQIAGPAVVLPAAALETGDNASVEFPEPGVYQFGTELAEDEDMEAGEEASASEEAEEDNELELVVRIA